MCTVLYKLALLNAYMGPALAEWRAVAVADYTEFMHQFDRVKPPSSAPISQPQPKAGGKKKRKKPKLTLDQANRQKMKKKQQVNHDHWYEDKS